MNIDFNGIAACIAAVGGLATTGMQVASWFDARQAKNESERHRQQLDIINAKVNTLVAQTPTAGDTN